ncbi:SurA N-terminal domain-containing protein [Brevibacillus centrosporus]|uniref:SurA N-terminal domain-containing protein n=1 Tax=Brevibacillus centrosporus TaxID=54910 RepID=UPI001143FFAC|nr:SurA N-terminal domain-containing protein [Brevibacillus centrosporus]MEC2133369.1 SurA N-terminal domain-containing protein [Brevibacillus centrosporus]GED34965.1 hypothetical protein BCE02nite_61060 [Brevibacillus centrosporus]
MKKKLIAAGIITTLILSVSIASFASEDPFFTFGQSISSKETNEHVGTVNNEEIDPKEVRNYQNYLEHVEKMQSKQARKEAINKIVEDTLLYNQAKKSNLMISKKEAIDFAKTQREQLEKAENADEVKKSINNLIAGLGISEEQYWDSYVVEGYMKYNSIGKLRAEILKDVEDVNEQGKVWADFIKGLKQSAKIELDTN